MDPAAPHETIGQRLRRLRIERGFTQRSLATDGVSHAHISRIEAGTRDASVKALRVLAIRLGVSADYLEHGVERADRNQLEHELADSELTLRLGVDPGVGLRLRALRESAERLGEAQLARRAAALAGLAAARDGEHQLAIEQLEAATGEEFGDPVADPDLFVTLGTSYLSLGRAEDAIALFERCVGGAAARIEAARSARARFATYLSYALTDDGKFDRASELLETLGSEPETDPYSRMRLAWAHARLEAMLGRLPAARAHLDQAIALLAESEDELQLARAEAMYAEMLVWEGQDELAEARLARAGALDASADSNDLGLVQALKGLIAIRRGDRETAEEHVLAALHILGESDIGRPILCLALGLVHLAADAVGDARHAYDTGLEALERASLWAQGATFCLAWADATEEHGLPSDAAAARRTAVRFAERVPVLATAGA
jgi:transcriptional regulator with XRE-family HTH domain